MQVKGLRFTTRNTASALWSQNGRSSVPGNLLYVDTWIRLCFLQSVYSVRYVMCAQVRVMF